MPLENPKTKWQPKTQCYGYNYGVGMNFYQPMVNFIDDKSKGRPSKRPHLPWTEELGLTQFDPQHVQRYSERDLSRISDRTERSAKIHQSTGRSHAGSGFMIEQSVLATRISTKVQQETTKKDKLVKEITKLKSRIRDDVDYDPQRDRKAERELMAEQKYLRGKSAKSIESQLLSSSRSSITQSIDHDLEIAESRKVRALSERRHVLPHHAWAEEMGIIEIKPLHMRSYSTHDLTNMTDTVGCSKVGAIVRKAARFVQEEAESVSEARSTKKIQHDTRKKNKLVTEIQNMKSRIKDDIEYDPEKDKEIELELKAQQKFLRGRSAKSIEAQLLLNSRKAITDSVTEDMESKQIGELSGRHTKTHIQFIDERMTKEIEESICEPLKGLKQDLMGLNRSATHYFIGQSKATSIEIEQLSARVVEAETRLKTEVQRIKKKLQIQITELEMSLDSANKQNIDLQKTVKRQSLQLTEITAHYEEVQRQLQVTLDQLSVAQRRVQALSAEAEEIRGNYEQALRSKKQVELMYEEASTRINELTTINVNLASSKSKIEQELSAVVADYDEVTKELRISDERYQRVQAEIKHTVEILHEEQERVVKIEAIKKSLEIEVKNLSIRLEEVEANAIVGGKRIISKLESRIHDMEAELDEEKRRHAETIKILRKKERTVKEVMIQCEEDQKNICLLQESLDKANTKIVLFKRQLQEQEGVSTQSVTRVRRFQRELEAAEDRADTAESSLSLIRAKHRTFVTTSSVPGSQVYLVQENRSVEM